MEFCTENYLNELLDNSEIYGFDAAKESFYECIANEGVGDALKVAGAVVGGIIMLPVAIVALAVIAAIALVGAILVGLYALIRLLINIPKMIAQAIAKKKDSKKMKSFITNNTGVTLAEKYNALSNAIAVAIKEIHPYMKKMSSITAGDKDKQDFTSDDVSKIDSSAAKLKKVNDEFSAAKTAYDEAFDEMNEKLSKYNKLTSEIKYGGIPFSEQSWSVMEKKLQVFCHCSS